MKNNIFTYIFDPALEQLKQRQDRNINKSLQQVAEAGTGSRTAVLSAVTVRVSLQVHYKVLVFQAL